MYHRSNTQYTNDALFEYLAVSILEVLPEEKLSELDAALAKGDDTFDTFLASQVPLFDETLRQTILDIAPMLTDTKNKYEKSI